MPSAINQLLMPKEQVLGTFQANVRYGLYLPHPGTVTLTNLRLLFTGQVLTDDDHTGWWWNEFETATIKKSLTSAEIALIHDTNTTSFMSSATGVFVTGRRRHIQALAQAANQFRTVATPQIHVPGDVRPGPTLRCSQCNGIPTGRLDTCRMCGRDLDWPVPLQPFTDALRTPSTVLPETFPNGKDTGTSTGLHAVALFAVAAYVQNETATLANLTEWLIACQTRDPRTPGSFGDLPVLEGIGDHENNRGLWGILRQFPSWLAPGAGPDREIFKPA